MTVILKGNKSIGLKLLFNHFYSKLKVAESS